MTKIRHRLSEDNTYCIKCNCNIMQLSHMYQQIYETIYRDMKDISPLTMDQRIKWAKHNGICSVPDSEDKLMLILE